MKRQQWKQSSCTEKRAAAVITAGMNWVYVIQCEFKVSMCKKTRSHTNEIWESERVWEKTIKTMDVKFRMSVANRRKKNTRSRICVSNCWNNKKTTSYRLCACRIKCVEYVKFNHWSRASLAYALYVCERGSIEIRTSPSLATLQNC